jgi:hypothetical protein
MARTTKGFGIEFDSKGFNAQLKSLAKEYEELTPKLQKKTVRKAFRSFAKGNRLTNTFKAKVPIGDDTNTWAGSQYQPGKLKKSVGTKVFLTRSNKYGLKAGQWVCKIGLMRSKVKDGWRGIFVDQGTKERFVGAGRNNSSAAKNAYKKGLLRSVGSIAARPFAAAAKAATLAGGRGSFLKYMRGAMDEVTKGIPAKPKKK